MRTTAIVLASALLLAYFVTETTTRLWPGNYTALLLVAAVAFMVHGFFTVRLAARGAAGQQPSGARNQKQTTGQARRSDGQRQPRSGDNRSGDAASGSRKRSDDTRPAAAKRSSGQSKPAAETSTAPAGPLETGEVKWFNRSKGYGFIIRDNGEEIFVHQRSVVGEGDQRQRPVLRDGQKVSFTVTRQDKGDQAEHVQPLD